MTINPILPGIHEFSEYGHFVPSVLGHLWLNKSSCAKFNKEGTEATGNKLVVLELGSRNSNH